MRDEAILLLWAVAGLASCQAVEPPPPPPQIVGVRVFSDPGHPIVDAVLVFNGREVAKTREDGLGQIKLNGRDGDVFQVIVRCPKGFDSPLQPIQVRLQRLADPKQFPEFDAKCPPSSRRVVVAVRAENGPNLPVVYLGREVAKTDDSGAAHVFLELKSGEQFDLTLNTAGEENAELKPQNPVASFSVAQQDDVFLFDQKFKVPEKAVIRWSGPKEPTGPVKIGNP